MPDARITIFDQSPTPFGLVRSGVAADHQGTKDVQVQFAQLFERQGVEFVGSTRVHTGEPAQDIAIHGRPSYHAPEVSSMHTAGAEITLQQLRDTHDAVIVATGLSQDKSLPVAGADADGVYGAGRIARLLNADATEHASNQDLPQLGGVATVVGNGNVAMDIVRLLAARGEHLASSDIHEATHADLTGALTTINVIGRSPVDAAKFDTVMLREIMDLPGINHTITGLATHQVNADDARVEMINELAARKADPKAWLQINWYFAHTSHQVPTDRGSVTGLRVTTDQSEAIIESSSIITAIGFCAAEDQHMVDVDEHAAATGRIELGLYVAGWLRRGPVGTIPTQRSDARELAELIATDFQHTTDQRAGMPALRRHLARATTWDGWLLIDAHEKTQNQQPRPRTKLTDARRMRLLAASATDIPRSRDGKKMADLNNEHLPQLTIAYATESGNAELVAEELVRAVADHAHATTIDLATLTPDELQTDVPMLVITSSYDEGELPTNIRALYAQLESQKTDLSGMHYALFGLGDTSYEFFSRGADILDDTFQALGARRIGDIGRHDAGGRTLSSDEAAAWSRTVIGELMTVSQQTAIVS